MAVAALLAFHRRGSVRSAPVAVVIPLRPLHAVRLARLRSRRKQAWPVSSQRSHPVLVAVQRVIARLLLRRASLRLMHARHDASPLRGRQRAIALSLNSCQQPCEQRQRSRRDQEDNPESALGSAGAFPVTDGRQQMTKAPCLTTLMPLAARCCALNDAFVGSPAPGRGLACASLM